MQGSLFQAFTTGIQHFRTAPGAHLDATLPEGPSYTASQSLPPRKTVPPVTCVRHTCALPIKEVLLLLYLPSTHSHPFGKNSPLLTTLALKLWVVTVGLAWAAPSPLHSTAFFSSCLSVAWFLYAFPSCLG